ncbi:hypothetical protein LT335_00129 [Spiroplasma sp. JKS002669]|uniref:hypothetical protein n=1 Tax=Spiroplasma attinicola TaxID=2904537 RepID=UPI002022EBE0|nr:MULTISPECIES: hypothetical protein [unclassified Spiroplasma]MCL6428590.1 hypothetical protein [Spiroplasma sp. JKS002669]MCL8210884.1 hypothetical protein [Spiroplasma sp. JKS002671]
MIPIIHKLAKELENDHVMASYVIVIAAGVMITGLLIWLVVMMIKKIISIHHKKQKALTNKKQKSEKTKNIIKNYKKIDSDGTSNLSL